MGAAWLVKDVDKIWENEASKNALMNTVRLMDTCEDIMGLGCHLLAVSKNSK